MLFIVSKAPIAGGVKSRLARTMGVVRASAWYRRALAQTLRSARASRLPYMVSAAPSARVWRAHSPLKAPLRDQLSGDLGRRMANVARRAYGSTLVVGCDIPGLTPAILRAAADALHRADLVIGPARDGGFYLVGLRTPAHAFRLYDGVRWSSPHALADTLANAPGHWRIAWMPMLSDVDEGSDLAAG